MTRWRTWGCPHSWWGRWRQRQRPPGRPGPRWLTMSWWTVVLSRQWLSWCICELLARPGPRWPTSLWHVDNTDWCKHHHDDNADMGGESQGNQHGHDGELCSAYNRYFDTNIIMMRTDSMMQTPSIEDQDSRINISYSSTRKQRSYATSSASAISSVSAMTPKSALTIWLQVIAAEGEHKASRSLRQAAEVSVTNIISIIVINIINITTITIITHSQHQQGALKS